MQEDRVHIHLTDQQLTAIVSGAPESFLRGTTIRTGSVFEHVYVARGDLLPSRSQEVANVVSTRVLKGRVRKCGNLYTKSEGTECPARNYTEMTDTKIPNMSPKAKQKTLASRKVGFLTQLSP